MTHLTLKAKATWLGTALVVALLAAVGVAQHRSLHDDFHAVLTQQQSAYADSVADALADKLEARRQLLEHAGTVLEPETLADPAASQRFLREVLAGQTLFEGVAIVGLDGALIAHEPPLPPGRRVDVRDRPYFQRLLATGQSSMSEPLQARTGAGAAVVLLAPARDAKGRLFAAVAGGVHLQHSALFGSLTQASIGRSGHVEIVTRGPAPIYVAHPDPARLLGAAGPAPSGEHDLVTRRDIRGVDWELRVMLPGADVDEPVQRARRDLVWLLAVLGLGAAALVWLGMDRLLRPLAALHDAIVALRRNPEAEVRLDTSGGDERGRLAREFAALMDELHHRQVEVDAVIQASPLGFFRADTDGAVRYVNDAYLRIHGLERDEMAQGWLQFVRAGIRAEVWEGWKQAMSRPETFTAVRRIVRRDGSSALLSVRSAPLVVGGRLQGHVGVIEDITQRAHAEKTLRVLATIFDSTTDYVVQTDRHCGVTYMNPAARRAFGIAPDAPLHGLHFFDFMTPATRERFERTIMPAVRAQGVWLGDSVVRGAEGRELPLSHMVIAHRDRQGRIDHYSGVMRDISAERAAQQETQRYTATLRSVTEALPAIVAVVGADLRYRFVNTAFERWIGRDRDAILGHGVADVLNAADFERSRPWIERVLAGETVSFERDYEAVDGRRHLALSYIPMRLDDGRIDGFVGVGHDITRHRREEVRLMAMAQRDPLTGLLNRAGLETHLEQRLQGGDGSGLALLYIDLDRFKAINDNHGHPVGDQLLRQFAQRLCALVRPTDAVARLGGDEFALVLDGVREPGHAHAVADKVIAAAAAPFQVGGLALEIGASIGVALGNAHRTGWGALVERADTNLYRAKQSGRGRQSGELH